MKDLKVILGEYGSIAPPLFVVFVFALVRGYQHGEFLHAASLLAEFVLIFLVGGWLFMQGMFFCALFSLKFGVWQHMQYNPDRQI